jgi:dienelactone hydrolase
MSKRARETGWLLAILAMVAPICVTASDVRDYARAPALSHVTISADGAHVSYVAQANGTQSVVLRTVADGRERHTLKLNPTAERIRWCQWAGLRYLLCGTVLPVRSERGVHERTRLYAIDAQTSKSRELNARLETPLHDQVIDFNGSQPGLVLLQYDSVGFGYPDVGELNVTTGQLTRILRAHPPVRHWMSDGRGQIRLGVGYDGSVGTLWTRSSADEWTLWLQQPLSDLEAVGPLAIGEQPTQLYALKHHNGRAALFELDLSASPKPILKFADPVYDITGPLLIEADSREVVGVRYLAEQLRLHYFDPTLAERHAVIDKLLPQAVNDIEGGSADGKWLLVNSQSDVEPPSTYLFDIGAGAIRLVGHHYPELEDVPLAPMQAIIYRARDGQPIPAYLTRPASSSTEPLPAIVLPHGGPETRVHRAFDPLVQFLAAQGYVVLQMNFRGSLGYGAGFAAAGVGQWGGIIHNDITDGARWLVEQGIADPARMCIVGQSFGGYAALLGAARESQWYSCAASYAAPTDLMALSQYVQRVPGALLWKERLGEDPRALWQMSPLSRVATVEVPVMLMHGRLDPVVPVSHARRFARALSNARKPHRFLERPDCDHDLTTEGCRVLFYSELRSFLSTSLVDQ